MSGLQHLPAWWNPSESPPQPENTSNVRYLGTLGLGCESGCSCAAEAFPLPLPWETKFNTLGFQRLLKSIFEGKNKYNFYLFLCPFLFLYGQLNEHDLGDPQSFLPLHYRPVKEAQYGNKTAVSTLN